jgi:hypothetical protein
MGAYANPNVKIIDTSYSNIGKALKETGDTISKSIMAKQQAQAKKSKLLSDRIKGIGDAYDKGILDSKKQSKTVAGQMPQKNAMKINRQLEEAFADGKQRLKDAVFSGKLTDGEVQTMLAREIAGANSFAQSIVGFSEVSKGVGGAIEAAEQSDGKAADAIFIGDSKYAEIFGIYNDDFSEGWGKVRLERNPSAFDDKGRLLPGKEWDYITYLETSPEQNTVGFNSYQQDDVTSTQGTGANAQTTTEIEADETVDFGVIGSMYQQGKQNELYTKLGNDEKSVKDLRQKLLSKGTATYMNQENFRTITTNIDVVDGVRNTSTVNVPNYTAIETALYPSAGGSSELSDVIDSKILSFGGGDKELAIKKYYQKYGGVAKAQELIDAVANAPTQADKDNLLETAFLHVKDIYITRNVLPQVDQGNSKQTFRVLSNGVTRTSTVDDPSRREGIRNYMQADLNYLNNVLPHSPGNNDPAENAKAADDLTTRFKGQKYGSLPGTIEGVYAGQYSEVNGQWQVKSGTEGNMLTIVTKDHHGKPAQTKYIDSSKQAEIKNSFVSGAARGKYTKQDDLSYIDYFTGPNPHVTMVNGKPVYTEGTGNDKFKVKTRVSSSTSGSNRQSTQISGPLNQ